ncbi:GFA family protein [Rhizobium sp. L1K21]|uniref:GFA family protein n=1 Tax=Rhizobium sp. L1K21 TaxID=2954933 RepID=UPI00209249F0|nr:GFA family protein [Rhizobium sp. L1K21]MCO6185837.1 GFA family protein [Rhizobium sp. L1K21]
MAAKYSGSCLCGHVKFEIEGEFEHFFLCHCSYCQKDTGSAHAANLFSTKAKLTWISGEGSVSTFKLPSTRHHKSFCSRCGSALPNLQMNGALVVVPAGSLDTKVAIAPDAHIFCHSRADWDVDLEQRPQLPGSPTG